MRLKFGMRGNMAGFHMPTITLQMSRKLRPTKESKQRLGVSGCERCRPKEELLQPNHTLATGQVGPPFTCPLPDGAGYQVVLRNAPPDHLAQSVPVLCSSKTNDCETGYECIQGLSAIDGLDGVCCPDQSNNNLRPPDIRPRIGNAREMGL
ncbi:hypothetical protein ANCCAN_14101 [Ancylostoma caninum]|uniref:Uncharacterized protein n=1 Tax=Ancylostoma caninum TaxID=29170 RepID=A0A368GAD8_ANCCA|nr:hypothetical protein ANCCAN_14101 [Ancylostoma caninum]